VHWMQLPRGCEWPDITIDALPLDRSRRRSIKVFSSGTAEFFQGSGRGRRFGQRAGVPACPNLSRPGVIVLEHR
jgi:hypothetical protein